MPFQARQMRFPGCRTSEIFRPQITDLSFSTEVGRVWCASVFAATARPDTVRMRCKVLAL